MFKYIACVIATSPREKKFAERDVCVLILIITSEIMWLYQECVENDMIGSYRKSRFYRLSLVQLRVNVRIQLYLRNKNICSVLVSQCYRNALSESFICKIAWNAVEQDKCWKKIKCPMFHGQWLFCGIQTLDAPWIAATPFSSLKTL